jgi:Winged helix-turn helix
MRPVSVFANRPASEIELLRGDPHGRWRQAARAVMVLLLLSARGLAPAQIAELLDCHPATVRRWISRFNAEGAAGLADRPRSGRPALGGRQLAGGPRCVRTYRTAVHARRPWPATVTRRHCHSKTSASCRIWRKPTTGQRRPSDLTPVDRPFC